MLGLSRVSRRARINVGNLGIRKISSRADNSAPFEKLKYASAFLLPAAGGMLVYFFTNYSTKILLEDVASTAVLSEFLPSKIKNTIPSTADYFQLKSDKEYISRKSVETAILEFISRTEADGIYCIIYGSNGVGKTTAVEAVIHGRPGILKVKVTTAENKQQFLHKVVQVTGQYKQNPKIDDFKESLR